MGSIKAIKTSCAIAIQFGMLFDITSDQAERQTPNIPESRPAYKENLFALLRIGSLLSSHLRCIPLIEVEEELAYRLVIKIVAALSIITIIDGRITLMFSILFREIPVITQLIIAKNQILIIAILSL